MSKHLTDDEMMTGVLDALRLRPLRGVTQGPVSLSHVARSIQAATGVLPSRDATRWAFAHVAQELNLDVHLASRRQGWTYSLPSTAA